MDNRRLFRADELLAYFEERLAQEQRKWLETKTEREAAVIQGRAQVWCELQNLPATFAFRDEIEKEKKPA